MIIFLTGMMGSGKTAVGQALAEKLGYIFIDLDRYLENWAGKTIPEIFRDEGEAAFRRMEHKIRHDPIMNDKDLVVATGGGFPLDSENRMWMKSLGVVIWLQAKPETILKRLENTSDRPLLPQPVNLSHIEELIEKRAFVYKMANYYIKTDDRPVDEIVREIMKRINHA